MSHPVRVRGLKRCGCQGIVVGHHLSHPVRVRGLKHLEFCANELDKWSHPVRVRGLKHISEKEEEACYTVAPRAGAWIETSCSVLDQS